MAQHIETIDAPDHPYIYELRQSLIQRHAADHVLPDAVHGALFLGGPMRDTVRSYLPAAARAIDRICPWVRTYVGGRPVMPDTDANDYSRQAERSYIIDGAPYSPMGGVAYSSHRAQDCIILLNGSCAPGGFAVTLLHECFHQVYRHLSDEARALLASDIATSRRWDSSYLDSEEERACRAFEAWAVSHVHGVPEPTVATGDAETLFIEVASGRWATGLMKRAHIQVSPHVLRRRGLLVRATTTAVEESLSRILGIAA
jgi:hypothetical protein